MTQKYIKITQEFAETNKNLKVDLNRFYYSITFSGIYFCDVNSLVTHPDIFKNVLPIEYIEIDPMIDVPIYNEEGVIVNPL